MVFEAAHDGDTDPAANETYALMPDTHACLQLDLTGQGWNPSPQCESRVTAAAHRARKAAS